MILTPLVSINIANYNNGEFITQCIQSVIDQSYQNIEIVIVDDCSSDDSIAKIRAFNDSRIQLHENKKNLGIAKVRNLALRYSSGAYISSLDSDDIYFSTDKIKQEMNVLEKCGAQIGKEVIAFSDVMLIDREGKNISRVSFSERVEEGNIFREILSRKVFIPRDYLCRREQILTVGSYNESLSLYEDWDLKLRLAERNGFFFSKLIGIGYRRHGSGLSSAPFYEHEYWKEKIISQYA